MAKQLDGGPAFPAIIPLEHSEEQGKDYPNYTESGMSLRDWFAGQAAGQALHGFLQSGKRVGWGSSSDLAKRFYECADAMLVERVK